jgi:hypothetical protein
MTLDESIQGMRLQVIRRATQIGSSALAVVFVVLTVTGCAENARYWSGVTEQDADAMARFRAQEERCKRITMPPERRVEAALIGGGSGMLAAFDLCMAQAGYERIPDRIEPPPPPVSGPNVREGTTSFGSR